MSVRGADFEITSGKQVAKGKQKLPVRGARAFSSPGCREMAGSLGGSDNPGAGSAPPLQGISDGSIEFIDAVLAGMTYEQYREAAAAAK